MIYVNCVEFCVDFKSLIRNNKFLKAKKFIFSDMLIICNEEAGDQKYDIFSFGHNMGPCAKNYKNRPSSLFLGINGLIPKC